MPTSFATFGDVKGTIEFLLWISSMRQFHGMMYVSIILNLFGGYGI